jgi:negative regulator of flagellin synthesis FlgM
MKIDNSTKSLITASVPGETERPGKKAAAPAATRGDSVQFSATSTHLRAIEQGFADTPIVNSARVAELKQAISDGHFRVDAEKVAQRLLSTVQELIFAHKA